MTIAAEIGIIVLLILINGFLAMSELAIVSSRRARLTARADSGSRGASVALAMAEHPGRFLSTVQIGITLVGILAGAYSGATLAVHLERWLVAFETVAPYAGSISVAVVVVGVTYASLIIGELVPKQVALSNPERVAGIAAPPMALLSRVAAPLVWLLDASSRAVLKVLPLRPVEYAMSEEEIRAVIHQSTLAGVLKPQEQEMLTAVMRFADRRVRAVMTPRVEVVWLDLEDKPDEIIARIRETKHSRYPVCKGEPDNLRGVVVAKDLLDAFLEGEPFDLRRHLRAVEVVPDTAGTLTVLERLKRSPIHLAVIVDEYGTFEGIVTATDILSALVGGLAEHGEMYEPQAVRREDGTILIDGDMDIGDARRILGIPDLGEGDSYSTLAGFALYHFKTVPTAGDAFTWRNLRFEVMDMDGRRIDKLLVSHLPAEGEAETPPAEE